MIPLLSRRGGWTILKQAILPVMMKNSELNISVQNKVKRKTSTRF